MTRDEVIKLAREALLLPDGGHPSPQTRHLAKKQEQIERFANLVRQQALEDAASIVENADTPDCGGWTTCGIADDIRALKGKK